MIRRSQRLRKRNMSEKDDLNHSEGSASESDSDKTIVEQDSVADLKEEIRSLRISLHKLTEKANTTSAPTEVASHQMPIITTVQLPHAAIVPSTAAACINTMSPDINTMPALHQPMQQKLSIDQFSLPPTFYPNVNLPYYSPSYIPPPSVQSTAFMPPPSVQSTASMPQQYVPSTSVQTCTFMQPLLPQPPTYTHQTTASTASTFMPTNNTNTADTTFRNQQNIYDYRPIRKLHDLPEFIGLPEQWPMFFVSYRETTQNYNYSKLENLSRLQKALKGDARAKVEAYLIHPESVDQIMSTLEFHFGRPQIMIRSQISKVRAFPPISGKRIHEIVNFSSMVSNMTVFLQNAGATPHLCNPTLLDELVIKLPLNKREEWMKYSLNHLSQYPSVREFSIWLQDIATYISLATEMESNKTEAASYKKEKVKSSFAITTEESRRPHCLLCKQNHYLNQCAKFKNISTAERWKLVKDKHLCFSCLHIGHSSLKCSNRRQCGLSKCTKYHNRLLHEEKKLHESDNPVNHQHGHETNGDANIPIISTYDNNENAAVSTIVDDSFNKRTLFKFLPVQLKGPTGCVKVIAFIDDGSKISLLEEKIAKQIGLQGPTSNLSLGWIGGKTSNEMSKRISLEIGNVGNDELSFQMKNVRTTGNLKLPPQSLHFNKFKEKFPVLNDIAINDYFDATPKLLIGLPHTRLVRPYDIVNLDENFSVHRTSLGNILFGSNEEETEATVCVVNVHILDDIQRQVSEYFTLESFGMRAAKPVISEHDKRAEDILQKTTMKNGLQYETGLLWKRNEFDFKESFSMALKRLRGVEAKMKKDAELAKWYENKIEEYISKCYARKLSPEEAAIEDFRTWYLPHFVITNVNKGNKRRLVFDAAAVVDGESFNSRLMKGPSEYQPKPLLSILFKFRQRQIGVCADIKEMFHRVTIREQDQTAQRFLWRNGDCEKPPDIYVMQAMIFGSASSPCSAQYVKNLNAKDYEVTQPRAYTAIVDSHYVDDYVDSFDTVDEAIDIAENVINIHKQASFELRGFVSNSYEFLGAITGGEVVYSDDHLTDLRGGGTTTEKILGLFWSPTDDTFRFILKFARVPEAVLNGSRVPTKSEVLSLTMSIFDPFGFLANMVIRSKILLQELWRYDIEWNSPIPQKIYEKWYEWYKELQNVQYVKVPRCYGPNFSKSSTIIELHIFVDASEVAFAAVGYWRIYDEGSVSINFVAGKSKCAPIKPLSIPRLELQAAVLGVRLKDAIISSHDIKPHKITFWSDSKTVISWIKSDCRIYKQFVSHRIAEILELSEIKQWRWVPGSQNPADDATRPQYFSENLTDSRWLNGPQFLQSEEVDWPKLPENDNVQNVKSEMRSKFLLTITNIGSLLPYGEKSEYYKLLRVRCWFIRAVKIFKCYASHQAKSVLNFPTYLTAEEVKEAEKIWCQIAQQEKFTEEYNSLKLDKTVSPRSPIFKLSPFLGQDGLIRISGRINNAVCVTLMTKEPIIMPKDHQITKLIVKQYHEDFRHQNQESICAAIRTKFWIPCLRQLIRSAGKNCQECKNRKAVPKPPLMGQHPVDRLTPFVRPFTYTGLDYMGPFTVSIGRRTEKRWVALFTCLTMRAIHVEIAKDLSTDSVILCIRNFINRRGVPIRIRSDRGTNFIGAGKENFVMKEARLTDECTRRGIEWVFNTPANPSAGGAWERMVRCVKNVLAFTLKEKSPQFETLNSLLIEAENLVNSRPLTHLPIENSESECLTPNHFLLGCPNIVQTPSVAERACLRKQWHILQQMKQTFWKRWVLEYLPDLTRRTKWYQPVKPIQVGDVVIICDDNEARGEWKRGIIEQVFAAADGQVRSALVKTSVGKLRRPASKLAVLDVNGESP